MDLDEAVELFNFLKEIRNIFYKYNKDARCKIFSIDEFAPEKHWSIDRWWTKKKKLT